ncbi:MAG: signal peptidase II [Clostridia bacterium]
MIYKIHIWISLFFLIVIEQGIKLIINSKFLGKHFPILEPWLYFKPMFNRDYSWLNSMLQLGIGKWVHILVVAGISILILLFYAFLNKEAASSPLIDAAFVFLFAGALCSLIDKIFWDGSLDYIQVKGLFTFDLKGVYVNVFVGLLLLMLLVNHQGIQQMDDRRLVKDFIRFLRGK